MVSVCLFVPPPPGEHGSLITMALGSTHVLYLEQHLAVFLGYLLKRDFLILYYSLSKTQLAHQRWVVQLYLDRSSQLGGENSVIYGFGLMLEGAFLSLFQVIAFYYYL